MAILQVPTSGAELSSTRTRTTTRSSHQQGSGRSPFPLQFPPHTISVLWPLRHRRRPCCCCCQISPSNSTNGKVAWTTSTVCYMVMYNFGYLSSCTAWVEQATLSSGHMLKDRRGVSVDDGDGMFNDLGSWAGRRTWDVTAYEL